MHCKSFEMRHANDIRAPAHRIFNAPNLFGQSTGGENSKWIYLWVPV